jgi:6,7-dimethyl-8-ribityllumazine synthase
MRFLIVAAKFNQLITRSLTEAAVDQLVHSGVSLEDIETVWVPGSFELPLVAREAALTKKYGAVICIGAVIKGETAHFDHVAGQAAAGIMRAGLDSGVPVVFGVLTTDTVEQALNRAGLKLGNKGAEAAMTALETVQVLKNIRRKE